MENIIEGPVIVKREAKADAVARARELLEKVGLHGKEPTHGHVPPRPLWLRA
jgi:cystine transport system ATP-binding protein